MTADGSFKGYLKPSISWQEGDELFLQPLYLVPVEVFSTGFFKRPEYKTVIVIVEAVGGQAVLVPDRNFPCISEGEPVGTRMPVNITPDKAAWIAETAAVSEGREGWRALAGSSHVMARETDAKSCWKVWIRSGEALVDSSSGRSFPLGEFLGLLLPRKS